MEIHITVTDRECKVCGTPRIICDNSGDTVRFTFDDEWEQYAEKIVYFVRGSEGDYSEYLMSGGANVAELPIITRAETLYVGVQAGAIRTTHMAAITVRPSIRSMIRRPMAEAPRPIVEQIMARMDELEEQIGTGGGGGSGVTVSYDADTGDLTITSTGSESSVVYDDATGNLQIG